jgi:hypothetical protein
VRAVTFVGTTACLVALYCFAAGRVLPPLRNEPATLLLVPMTVIAGVVASFVYPWVRRQPQRSRRAAALYVGFALSTAIYGGYLWAMVPDGTAWLILVAVLAGHMYGLPLFLVLVATHLAMDRWLFPLEIGRSEESERPK